MQPLEVRRQTRYYDHEKTPSKELIEKVLHKAHDLVPSKQNLMPYVIKILGPEHTKIKEDMYKLSCEVEYPDEVKRNDKRLGKYKVYTDYGFPPNKRFPEGNSQLFAPYVLILIPRKPTYNIGLANEYIKQGTVNKDQYKLQPTVSKVEIGMFSVCFTTAAIEEGLSVSYTACLNGKKLRNHYSWLKEEEHHPTLALSVGYPRIDKETGTETYHRHTLKYENKPSKNETFRWI
tara:strand:+ start:45 stop:743 length:699 start_codon:yes stop_codon:yes gene_type:complete